MQAHLDTTTGEGESRPIDCVNELISLEVMRWRTRREAYFIVLVQRLARSTCQRMQADPVVYLERQLVLGRLLPMPVKQRSST